MILGSARSIARQIRKAAVAPQVDGAESHAKTGRGSPTALGEEMTQLNTIGGDGRSNYASRLSAPIILVGG
ncbi:hypothetical protein RRF57_007385 [Xylaria bambusicola]|uniref:Uncharacterized protein n=1 Tax=Xylaria bambusicola TaxID=326684 RepID=A0AAN7ZAD8_9PEZI